LNHYHVFWVSIKSIDFKEMEQEDTFTGHWWLMPVILPTSEAEIRRIEAQDQPKQIVREIPSPTKPEQNGLEVWLKQ
jgi:hypothetical protein